MENFEQKAFELLETKSDETGRFSGYAATYDKDAYGDRIAPGAFERTIQERRGRVPIFLDHDRAQWVGFSTELIEKPKGLYIHGALSLKSQRGADTYALLQLAQELDFKVGLSIGFILQDFEMDERGRTLKSIDLFETSVTAFPVNRHARINDVKSVRDLEQCLRDAGCCSKEGAKRALALLQPYLLTDVSGEPKPTERDARSERREQTALAIRASREILNAGSSRSPESRPAR